MHGEELKTFKIGEKIRILRETKGLSVSELAFESGLSEPVISEIEKNVIAPPIATLLKISNILGVEMEYFFKDRESEIKFDLVRKNERKNIRRKLGHRKNQPLTYIYEKLSSHHRGYRMQPFLIKFDIDIEEALDPIGHRGEEFLYLLEGELEYRLLGERIILKEGDSLHFDSKVPHAFYGKGQIPPKAILIICSSEK